MKPHLLMVNVFGLGLSPFASGTVGSVPPVVVATAMAFAGVGVRVIDVTMIAIGIVFGAACVIWGKAAESHYGRKDPGQVVADEVAGQCIALLALPWRIPTEPDALTWNLGLAFFAFFFFRLFDVIKPPPCNQIQRVGGGWGILLDDLLAGVYALIATQLVARFLMPVMV